MSEPEIFKQYDFAEIYVNEGDENPILWPVGQVASAIARTANEIITKRLKKKYYIKQEPDYLGVLYDTPEECNMYLYMTEPQPIEPEKPACDHTLELLHGVPVKFKDIKCEFCGRCGDPLETDK